MRTLKAPPFPRERARTITTEKWIVWKYVARHGGEWHAIGTEPTEDMARDLATSFPVGATCITHVTTTYATEIVAEFSV